MDNDDDDCEDEFEDDDDFEDDDELEQEFDDDFLQLLPLDASLLYECVIHAIKTNSGIGFHNNDQGQLAYVGGTLGMSDVTLGEVADENELFSLLNRLAEIVNKDSKTGVKVYSWPEFCQMAVDAKRQK